MTPKAAARLVVAALFTAAFVTVYLALTTSNRLAPAPQQYQYQPTQQQYLPKLVTPPTLPTCVTQQCYNT